MILDSAVSGQENSASFVLLGAEAIQKLAHELQLKPDYSDNFISKQLAFNVRVVSEQANGGKEFEFHEHTDHIIQIVEGTTHFDVGGTAQDAHRISSFDWLAPSSRGSTSIDMVKGDVLIIPRGTPHKRTTKSGVVFLFIAVTGAAPS